MCTYLDQVGTTYYFRRPVPHELTRIDRKVALRTACQSVGRPGAIRPSLMSPAIGSGTSFAKTNLGYRYLIQ